MRDFFHWELVELGFGTEKEHGLVTMSKIATIQDNGEVLTFDDSTLHCLRRIEPFLIKSLCILTQRQMDDSVQTVSNF